MQISIPAKLLSGAVNAAEQDPKSLQVHVPANMSSSPFPWDTFRNVHIFLLCFFFSSPPSWDADVHKCKISPSGIVGLSFSGCILPHQDTLPEMTPLP